jgi:uncharacterized protein (DUF1697 family)
MGSKYIVLLRGINVGGKRKILMKDLKSLLETNDYQNIQTYIQSGNIILETPEKDNSIIENHISKLIKVAYGFDVPVMALGLKKFTPIFKQNPFIDQDIKSLHVTVLSTPQDDV